MMFSCQPSETCFDLSIGSDWCYTKSSVEVTCYSDVMKCLNQAVDKVDAKDKDSNSAMVLCMDRVPWLRMRASSLDSKSVVQRL